MGGVAEEVAGDEEATEEEREEARRRCSGPGTAVDGRRRQELGELVRRRRRGRAAAGAVRARAGPIRAPRAAAEVGGERGRGGGARLEESGGGVTWRKRVGWGEVEAGCVRRGRTRPAARGGKLLGFHLRNFRRETNIYR